MISKAGEEHRPTNTSPTMPLPGVQNQANTSALTFFTILNQPYRCVLISTLWGVLRGSGKQIRHVRYDVVLRTTLEEIVVEFGLLVID